MRFLGACVVCFTLMTPVAAITLEEYLQTLRESHPLFDRERLSGQIERKRQDELRAGEDWSIAARPSYGFDEPVQTSFLVPDEVDNVHVAVGLQRPYWRTGGRVGLSYDYDYTDQAVPQALLPLGMGESVDIAGPSRFFENTIALSYTQPLLRNRGGQQDRLDYELQGYTAAQTELGAVENQEGFLRDVALRFIDWALLDEEHKIAERRLQLAGEQRQEAQKRLDANLIEEVDLLRVEDAVIVGERNVKLVASRRGAVQAELGVLIQSRDFGDASPAFDLYRRAKPPDPDAVVRRLLARSRVLDRINQRVAQVAEEHAAAGDDESAQLDLVLTGGAKDGAEDNGDATEFSRLSYGLALTYTYPLGNTGARARIERLALEQKQTRAERHNVALQIEAGVRALLAEIRALEPVLDLNARQIATGAKKTAEEQRLYEQGRNQLTFVIQSRDDEARAQLAYAQNAANYHRLIMRLKALTDTLLPAD